MTNKPSPLQLASCYFTKVRVDAQAKAQAKDFAGINLDVHTEAWKQNPENLRQWYVQLKVHLEAKEAVIPSYLAEVEAIGTFTVDDSWKEDLVERLVYINGSGILYSSIREMICTITARGFWPMLTLPSWSFSEMYKELERVKQEALKKKQAADAAIAPAAKPLAEATKPADSST